MLITSMTMSRIENGCPLRFFMCCQSLGISQDLSCCSSTKVQGQRKHASCDSVAKLLRAQVTWSSTLTTSGYEHSEHVAPVLPTGLKIDLLSQHPPTRYWSPPKPFGHGLQSKLPSLFVPETARVSIEPTRSPPSYLPNNSVTKIL